MNRIVWTDPATGVLCICHPAAFVTVIDDDGNEHDVPVDVNAEAEKVVPHGVAFFQQLYGLPKDPAALPDAFAALAPHCPVFRIDPLPPTGAS